MPNVYTAFFGTVALFSAYSIKYAPYTTHFIRNSCAKKLKTNRDRKTLTLKQKKYPSPISGLDISHIKNNNFAKYSEVA